MRPILILILAAWAASARAASDAELYQRWLRLSSDSLVSLGRDYGFRQHQMDSAIICFTMVADRYSPQLSRAEKRACIEALNLRFHAFNATLFDYAQGYESLTRALAIARDLGETDALLSVNFGLMYQVLAEQSADSTLYAEAMNYYRQGFAQAIADHNQEAVEMAFPNMVTVAQQTGAVESLRDVWAQFLQATDTTATLGRLHRYNELLYRGVLFTAEGLEPEAVGCFEQQLRLMPDDHATRRFHCLAYYNMADAQAQAHRYDEAEQSLLKARAIWRIL